MADVAKLTMSLDDIIASHKPDRPKGPKKGGANKPAQLASNKPAPTQGPRKGLKKNRNRGKGPAPMDMDDEYGAPAPKQQRQQAASLRSAPPLGSSPRRVKPSKQGRVALAVKPAIQKRGPPPPRNVLERGNRGNFVAAPVAPPAPRVVDRQDPRERQAALDGNARWQHDLYQGPPASRRPQPALRAAASLSSKLIITNLHHDVTQEDLLELFSTMGTVKNHKINFDASGRSLGTGFVEYETRAEAENAKKQYNNVELDRQPMKIEFADALGSRSGTIPARLSSGITVGKVNGSSAPRTVGPGRLLQQAGLSRAGGGRPGRSGDFGGRMNGRLRSVVQADMGGDDMQD